MLGKSISALSPIPPARSRLAPSRCSAGEIPPLHSADATTAEPRSPKSRIPSPNQPLTKPRRNLPLADCRAGRSTSTPESKRRGVGGWVGGVGGDTAEPPGDAKIASEKKTHKRCLKTESCYFNYGLSALSPIAFLTHSSANLVINQLWVARSCSLAPSLSLPRSLRALAPLVCSPVLPVCAFLIGFGLELVASGCPQHRFHTASFGWGGRQALAEETADVPASLRARARACPHAVWVFLHPRGFGGGIRGCSCPMPGCRHWLLCRFPLRLLLLLVPRNPAGRATAGGCPHAGCTGR